MKKSLFIILFYIPFFLFGQNSISVDLKDSITIKTNRFVGKDIYNNYYSISQNTFIKQNKNEVLNYQNLALGNIFSVDYSNPLLIVIFYKDFNSIILLDQQLNEVQKISGNDFGLIFEVTGLARQNSLWFYDTVSQKFGIYQFNENTFKFISIYLPTKIVNWKSSYNNFEWITDENIIYSINYFGKIKNLGSIPQSESTLILDENQYLLKLGEKLYLHSLENKREILIPQKSFENFCFKDGILSIFTNDKVYNYKLNIP